MGLGLEHVQSDSSHYLPFVCQLCNCLADLDALVTGKCNHPFCKGCMTTWDSTNCPGCQVSMDPSAQSCSCRQSPTGTDIAPLHTTQPLAHACLSKIQISCPHCMTWEGDYGDLEKHVQTCTAAAGKPAMPVDQGRRKTRRSSSDLPSKSPLRAGPMAGRRHSMETHVQTDKKPLHTDEAYPVPVGSAAAAAAFYHQPPSNSATVSSSLNASTMTEASLLKEKGNAKFNKGEYAEARQYYDQALTLIKDLKRTTPEERTVISSLYCNRGATHGKERNVDGAIRDYDTAIRIAPDYGKAYSRKFKVLAAQGKLRESKVLLECAVLNVLGDKGLIEDLRKMRQIVDGIESIKKLLQLRNYSEAKQLGDVLMKSTDNPEAVLLSAEADASIGLIEAARDKCLFVLKTDPDSAIGMKTSGYISLLGGNVEVAISDVKNALKCDPNNVEAKDLFRFCRKVQSDLAEGRACIAKAAEGGSRTVLKKAVDCFSTSIDDGSLPPKSPLLCMLRIERSEAELQLMYYQPALSDARLAIEVNPTSVRAWVVKAESYIATGRATEVRDELLEAQRTWAKGINRIKDMYTRAALECKIHEADKELRAMVPHASVEKKEGGTKPQDGMSKSDHRDNRQRGLEEKRPRNMRRQSIESAVSDKSGDSRPQQQQQQQQQRRASVARRSSNDARPAAGRRSSEGDRPAANRAVGGERAQNMQRRPPENARNGTVDRRPAENGRMANVERRPAENGRTSKGEHTRVNSVGNGAKQPQKRKPTLSEADARRRTLNHRKLTKSYY